MRDTACQQFKWSPGGTQQLTHWMGFHGCMSASQMEPRRHKATHSLDGISWQNVSKSNGAQEAHSNSLPGWNFMAACQQFKWSPGGTQQLTSWMEFHSCMSAIQMEPRRCTTHILDIGWIISVLSIWNPPFNFLITSCMLCSEFPFLSLWISYFFPLITCIFSILSNVLDVIPTYCYPS